MIQFNLLPDIKQEYIKAAKLKRLVISISVIITAVSLALLLFVSIGYLTRSNYSNALAKDIEAAEKDLTETEDINKILTVQNQLKNLPSLHEDKPAASRIFEYLSRITPGSVTLSELNFDFATNTVTFQGNSEAIANVNQFIDTIKFTKASIIVYDDDDYGRPTYLFDELSVEKVEDKILEDGSKVEGVRLTGKAFDQVVLSDYSHNDEGIEYEIIALFDPLIFEGTRKITLQVPSLTTTRSEIEVPEVPLFVENKKEEEQ